MEFRAWLEVDEKQAANWAAAQTVYNQNKNSGNIEDPNNNTLDDPSHIWGMEAPSRQTLGSQMKSVVRRVANLSNRVSALEKGSAAVNRFSSPMANTIIHRRKPVVQPVLEPQSYEVHSI